MAAAEGQCTNQTGQATPAVHDEIDTGHNNQKNQHSQLMTHRIQINLQLTRTLSLVQFSIQMKCMTVQRPANY